MEIELAVLDSHGTLDQGGSVELVAAGPGPMNEAELLITIALLLLLGIVFSLSSTGKAVFDAIDNYGRADRARVTDGGGGGAEFTVENR